MGAQGAGIATAVSYFAVFVFRAIHSKSFMPFRLGAGKLAINSIIVCAQVVFMVLNLPYNLAAQVLLVGTMCAVNARSLISAVKKVLKKIIKI
jgi:hypothetical protein